MKDHMCNLLITCKRVKVKLIMNKQFIQSENAIFPPRIDSSIFRQHTYAFIDIPYRGIGDTDHVVVITSFEMGSGSLPSVEK